MMKQLEQRLKEEYAILLENPSEVLYYINISIGYGSRYYKEIATIGSENIENTKPKKNVRGTFAATVMRRQDDKEKWLVAFWSIIAWKGDDYLISVQFYTNEQKYLEEKRLYDEKGCEMQRKYVREAFGLSLS